MVIVRPQVMNHSLQLRFGLCQLIFLTLKLFFQWGAAYRVEGDPEKERLAMEVILYINSNLACLDGESRYTCFVDKK